MNDLFQMIATTQRAHVAGTERAVRIAAQQHGDQLAHLVDVVALLPFAHLAPCDLRRRAEWIEGISGDAAAAGLVGSDAKIAQLETLVLAYKHVERCQIAMHGLAAVQHGERLQHRGDLLPYEFLRLAALFRQPRAKVTVLRVFHHQTVARDRRFDLHEPVEDGEGPALLRKQLSEVRFAEPVAKPITDFDTHARRNRPEWRGCGQKDLSEPTLPDELLEVVGPARLSAVETRKGLRGSRRHDQLRAAREVTLRFANLTEHALGEVDALLHVRLDLAHLDDFLAQRSQIRAAAAGIQPETSDPNSCDRWRDHRENRNERRDMHEPRH